MTRVDELSLKLADGALSDAEATELAGLIEQDPVSAQAHLRLLQIEVCLRGQRKDLQLVDRTMAQIRQHSSQHLSARILTAIKAAPAPEWQRRSAVGPAGRNLLRRPGSMVAWSLATAAVITLLVGSSIWLFGPTVGEPVLASATGGNITIERHAETVPPLPGLRLQPGDALLTDSKASATISFGAEQTHVDLRPETQLILISFTHGKRFQLRAGRMDAKVARQRPFRPMLITTVNAEARVLGTQFSLTATTNGTRLDVAEGNVRLRSRIDGKSVEVSSNHYAIAAGSVELSALPITGRILRAYWTNVTGNSVNDLFEHAGYPDRPSGRDYLTQFEIPPLAVTNYGCRVVGYLHPPVTGDYFFWIAAAPAATLYLSRDEDPADVNRLFIWEYDAPPRQWLDAPENLRKNNSRTKSAPVPLVAGRRYFIEGLLLSGKPGGHLSIAWQIPGRGERELISGEYLSPLETK